MCSMVFHSIKYSSHRLKYIHSEKRNEYENAKHYEKALLDIYAVFIQQSSADTALVFILIGI